MVRWETELAAESVVAQPGHGRGARLRRALQGSVLVVRVVRMGGVLVRRAVRMGV